VTSTVVSPLKHNPEKGDQVEPDGMNHAESFTVKRVWEDFEFLHQCLTMAAFPSSNGLIIPSLPLKVVPSPDAKTGVNAYDHLVKQLSQSVNSRHNESHSSPVSKNNSNHHHPIHNSNPYVKAMLIPDFRSDCHQLEQYLTLMLTHPTFGKNIDVWERLV
jgi:hypothetical protein